MIITLPVGDEIDDFAVLEAQLIDVTGIHEHDPAATRNSAVAITEPVDRGIELIMAAQGLQDQMTRWHLQCLDRRHRELGTPGVGRECTRVPRGVWQQKTAWAGDVDLIGLTTGNDSSDEATNLTIVIAHAPPVNAVAITERRLGELGDDRNFGPQMRTGWSQRSARDVHRARGVLH